MLWLPIQPSRTRPSPAAFGRGRKRSVSTTVGSSKTRAPGAAWRPAPLGEERVAGRERRAPGRRCQGALVGRLAGSASDAIRRAHVRQEDRVVEVEDDAPRAGEQRRSSAGRAQRPDLAQHEHRVVGARRIDLRAAGARPRRASPAPCAGLAGAVQARECVARRASARRSRALLRRERRDELADAVARARARPSG